MTVSFGTPMTHHIGYVAKDCEKMARAYERLIGAKFDILPALQVVTLYDGPGCIKVAYGAFGGLVVEIIEVVYGDLPHKRWLDTYGEGIQHIGFWVPDPVKATADLVAAGGIIEWIADDTNHTAMGYLTPNSTQADIVNRMHEDCLSYITAAGVGNVAIEFLGPKIQGRMINRWDGEVGDTKTSGSADPQRGGAVSEHPLLGDLVIAKPDNWFTGQRR